MKRIIYLLSVLFFTNACVTNSGMKRVDPYKEYVTDTGFRFKLAMSGEWFDRSPKAGVFMFGKKLFIQDGSTVLAEVRAGHASGQNANEILESIRQGMMADTGGPRSQNAKSDFKRTKFKGAECSRFEQTAEDHGAKTKQAAYMMLSMRGIVCLHPRDPHRWIRMIVSQRVPAGKTFTNMAADEKSFYDSLEFLEFLD
jgi:hypothetical protein